MEENVSQCIIINRIKSWDSPSLFTEIRKTWFYSVDMETGLTSMIEGKDLKYFKANMIFEISFKMTFSYVYKINGLKIKLVENNVQLYCDIWE